jgi:hypothetical protein
MNAGTEKLTGDFQAASQRTVPAPSLQSTRTASISRTGPSRPTRRIPGPTRSDAGVRCGESWSWFRMCLNLLFSLFFSLHVLIAAILSEWGNADAGMICIGPQHPRKRRTS